MARRRLTDALVKALPCPPHGQVIIRDDQVTGLGIRCTAGSKTFVLSYRSKTGRSGRLKIGSFPTWTVGMAREEARKARVKIELGADPAQEQRRERVQHRGAGTVSALCDLFLDQHVPRKRPRTQAEYRGMIEYWIRPELGAMQITEVKLFDIDKLHSKISKTAKHSANRVVAVLSKMFSLAATKWQLRPDNPCKGIERNPERPRQRYLSEAELERLHRALAQYEHQDSADAVRLLILTGARKLEVLSARWSQFDLDNGAWTKPASHTKQAREHRVPLSGEAIKLLRRRRKQTNGEYVFPTRFDSKDRHLTRLAGAWKTICEAADIRDCRLHDLRHSYASLLASSGQSLPIIGALLGHSHASTTQRYAHLLDESLRKATEGVGKAWGKNGE
jgi:integrase